MRCSIEGSPLFSSTSEFLNLRNRIEKLRKIVTIALALRKPVHTHIVRAFAVNPKTGPPCEIAAVAQKMRDEGSGRSPHVYSKLIWCCAYAQGIGFNRTRSANVLA